FMSDPEKAKELATAMVELGKRAGVTTRALVTAMDVPLGKTAGNALEVRESVEVLAGGGPSDVVELTLVLAREMLDAAGVNGKDPEEALKDGSAMDHWRRMVKAQGGDPDAPLPTARETKIIRADRDGVISSMNALQVGISAWRLGAGRERQGESVQAGAGIEIHAKPGDQIKKGETLFSLHTDEAARFERAEAALEGAVVIGSHVAEHLPLVIAKID
ncbi:MAG: thymidine phosphorylase, partial [Candidatus Nanopelagicaceae bacterium]